MDGSQLHLWGKRTGAGCFAKTNGGHTDVLESQQNNLNKQESIEDNSMVASCATSKSNKNPLPRQKSLSHFENELQSILRRCIEENLLKDPVVDDVDDKTSNIGNRKPPDNPTTRNTKASSGIYSAHLQQGDGNVMLLCEPIGPPRTTKCSRQVGNNNVMVNVTVNTNRCQIIDEHGAIFPIDSDGEFWLEIKKRQTSTSGTASSTFSGCSPTTPSPGGNICQQGSNDRPASYDDARLAGIGEEGGYSEVIRISSPYLESRMPGEQPRRMPVEHYDSFRECLSGSNHISQQEPNIENIRIDERPDSIVMKFEAPRGSKHLSVCQHFEDCDPVREALGHKKVMDFLERQGLHGFDLDVSVIGWEYEREEVYSTIPLENGEGSGFSSARVGVVRKPTLPPRDYRIKGHAQKILSQPSQDEQYDSIKDLETEVQDKKQVPVLPPRLYKEVEENDERIEADKISKRDFPPANPQFERDDRAFQGSKSPRFQRSVRMASNISESACGTFQKSEVVTRGCPTNTANKAHGCLGIKNQSSDPSSTAGSEGPGVKKGIPLPPNKPKMVQRQNKTKHEFPRGRGRQLQATWYYGAISSEQAREVLRNKSTGSFLVRDTKGEHRYTLELVDTDTIRRLKIWCTDGKYRLEKGPSKRTKTFDSVEGLIETAMKTGVEFCNKKSPETWKTVAIFPVDKTTIP